MSLLKSPTYVRESILGAVGILVGAGAFATWEWHAQPYGQVEVIDVVREGNGVRVSANFVKYGCDLETFIAYGIVAGRPIPLPHVDLHGREDNENREPGFHALDIVVRFGDWWPEKVEMRTVHNCGAEDEPEIVAKVFATVPIPGK